MPRPMGDIAFAADLSPQSLSDAAAQLLALEPDGELPEWLASMAHTWLQINYAPLTDERP